MVYNQILLFFNAPIYAPVNPIKWTGNEYGVGPDPDWLTTMNMQDCCGADVGSSNGSQWCPPEVDVTLQCYDTWFWCEGTPLRDLFVLMNFYVQSVGRSGNLLLDIAPSTVGQLPADAYESYSTFGNTIKQQFGTPIAQTFGNSLNITLNLPSAQKINVAMMQEDLSLGQMVHSYVIYAQVNNKWVTVFGGESIGHKRIANFTLTTTSSLLLEITSTLQNLTPHISNFAVFSVSWPF